MREYGAFRYPGYYTYIMIAANEGLIPGMPFFFSPQEFVDYLKALDLDGLPGRSTIYDTISKVSGRYPDWTFNDQPKAAEELRRKNIVKQFLSAFGRAKRRLSDGFSENRWDVGRCFGNHEKNRYFALKIPLPLHRRKETDDKVNNKNNKYNQLKN